MEDHQSSDEDYQHSDQGSVDDLENAEDPDSKLVTGTSKGSTIMVIRKETLVTAQEEDLSRIMALLSVKEKHQARMLLIFHRWDMENLSAKFVEKGKPLLYAEAGVSEEEHRDSASSGASSMMCGNCHENVPCDQATRMDCGHCFCNDCWREHFIVKIKEGQSKHIRCMEHKCNYYCNEDVVRKLVSEESSEIAEKFERFLLESYIEDNKRAKWCPSTPHCGNAIYVEDDDDTLCEVECSCGFQFCFSCLSEPHSPCSCLMRELWVEKCVGEYDAAWIKNDTRPCPKCNISGKMIGGCNTVTCIFGQTFCWLGARAKTAMEAKREESHHGHYYDRYKAHMESLDKERKLRESIVKKGMDYSISTHGDYRWLNDGVSTLVRSRRVLSYSYPFELYMFEEEPFKHEISDEEREIKYSLFKDHQEQLEAKVEKLSEILKMSFESSNEVSDDIIRMQVINLSAVINKFCEGMYEFIQNDLLGSLSHGTHHRIAPYKLSKQQ